MVATMFQEDQMQLDRWVSDIDVSATSRSKIIRPWSRHASRPESRMFCCFSQGFSEKLLHQQGKKIYVHIKLQNAA